MFTIDQNGIITISRGDSFTAPLFINQGSDVAPVRYRLTSSDRVVFYLMYPNCSFERSILTKEYTDVDQNEFGDVLVEFIPSDTQRLPAGKYYYEVRLYLGETGEINTVIPKSLFYILD